MSGRSTEVSKLVHAPREAVYRAFLDADAVAEWLPPDTMKGRVLDFEPHPGGKFRIALTYQNAEDRQRGKSSDDTDIAGGTFGEMVPNEKIVWITTFDSDDPAFAGEMTITWLFKDADDGTEVTSRCDNIPSGVRLEDNQLGSQQSLNHLAQYVE
jgi:uncharacterized protein YndB with AHSA1/START domain